MINAQTENPLGEIVRDIAKQKEFKQDTDIVEDVVIEELPTDDTINIDELVEEGSAEDEQDTEDYYDSKGKLMTVRY